MWSDTLLEIERLHLLRLTIWGSATLAVGAVLWLAVGRRAGAPLPRHFAIHLALWGGVIVALARRSASSLALRDHAGAVRLDEWAAGILLLSLMAVVCGVTLALTGWLRGRRLAVVGAGLGVALHGAAVGALHLMLRRGIVV